MTTNSPDVDSPGTTWDRRYAEHPWPTDPDGRLVELVSDLAPGRALDLGCGTGRNALWLARMGWSVTGVDASSVGLSKAKEAAGSINVELTLIEVDLANYEPAVKHFDLVVVANMHFAANERAAFYSRAVSAVAPGGHLFVVGHHVESLGRTGPPDAARLFTEELVTSFAEGLVIDFVERENRWVNAEPKPLVDVVLWAHRAVSDAAEES